MPEAAELLGLLGDATVGQGLAVPDKEVIEREDLVMFINACFACTRQQEFYSDKRGQAVSIEFLHSYILGNYRRLYARTLAAGINHFNQALILLNLLAAGSPDDRADREEEGRLIAEALKRLPANRAFQVMRALRERRVNNRRTRAVVKRYLTERRDMVFDAVKYRAKFLAAATHNHLKLEGELGPFLFSLKQQKSFSTPLFEAFRQAHYSGEAIYQLPYTVAEGLAARHGIDRDEFLAKIEGQMTAAERLRLQESSREEKVKIDIDLGRVPLTRLGIYLLSLKPDQRLVRHQEFHLGLEQAARRALGRSPVKLGRVAAVLDASYSASGSSEKRRRPLGVALGASYLLRAAAKEYRPFWVPQIEDELMLNAHGQTALGSALLDALEYQPDLVVIISDGFENDPPFGAAEVARVFRARIDPEQKTEIVHMNPVFDAQNYAPRTIGAHIPTVGLRDAEDIPTMLGFARFSTGGAPLSELEDYLARRVEQLLSGEAA